MNRVICTYDVNFLNSNLAIDILRTHTPSPSSDFSLRTISSLHRTISCEKFASGRIDPIAALKPGCRGARRNSLGRSASRARRNAVSDGCMQFRTGYRTLTDCCAYSLSRARAYIPGGKDAANARLQLHRTAGAIVTLVRLSRHIRSGQNKILFIQGNTTSLEPVRCRVGADEKKDVTDPLLRFLTCHIVAPSYSL